MYSSEFTICLDLTPCTLGNKDIRVRTVRQDTLLLSIFISTSVRVSGNYMPIIRRNILYLCDTGIFHSVISLCNFVYLKLPFRQISVFVFHHNLRN